MFWRITSWTLLALTSHVLSFTSGQIRSIRDLKRAFKLLQTFMDPTVLLPGVMGGMMASYHAASGWLRQTAETGAAHLRQGRAVAQGGVHGVHAYPRCLWNQRQTCRHEELMCPHTHTHARRPLFTLVRNMFKRHSTRRSAHPKGSECQSAEPVLNWTDPL